MRRFALVSASIVLLAVLAAGTAYAVPTQWPETWEGYTDGTTPYDDWNLQTGTWGSISTPGRDSAKCYSIAAGQASRLTKGIELGANSDPATHFVLQGWFKDSGDSNSSMLGFGDGDAADNNGMIRIGATGAATYQVQYYDGIAGGEFGPWLFTVDTGLPVERGWHFMRIDLEGPGFIGLWTTTYRVWNAARTLEKKGVFYWWFSRETVGYVTLGAPVATTGAVAWDDIKVGTIADVGNPPTLPMRPVVGMNNRSLGAGGAVQVGAGHLFYKTWGMVSTYGPDEFYLNDGSQKHVLVICPNHGLTSGQYVSAFGAWNFTASPARLESDISRVQAF